MGEVLIGHALDVLPQLPAESVHLCVTSPPYWGLRDYKAPAMVWGDNNCEHVWGDVVRKGGGGQPGEKERWQHTGRGPSGHPGRSSAFCQRCGAWRGQLGLEPTPELYVEHLVQIFREVRRVLRDDGVCWLNLGDSFASGKGTCYNPGGGSTGLGQRRKEYGVHPCDRGNALTLARAGLKPKDLVGIPWLVAFALRADGWYLRRDVIWSKPNPMPESCRDRPTSAHEYIFLLTKSARYYYDADAVREPHTTEGGYITYNEAIGKSWHSHAADETEGNRKAVRCQHPAGRNLRSVWTFATQPYPEAHFATFPLELPLRCIRTSPPKCCKKCGAGWERVVEKQGESKYNEEGKPQGLERSKMKWNDSHPSYNARWWNTNKTLGFRPTCTCYPEGEEETAPAIILDPFAGSGTVGEAATKLGRDYILIEVNPEYGKLIEKRTQAITAPVLPEAL
jgi:DNA modification methylase